MPHKAACGTMCCNQAACGVMHWYPRTGATGPWDTVTSQPSLLGEFYASERIPLRLTYDLHVHVYTYICSHILKIVPFHIIKRIRIIHLTLS